MPPRQTTNSSSSSSSSSLHRDKRPYHYQPTITDFFHTTDANTARFDEPGAAKNITQGTTSDTSTTRTRDSVVPSPPPAAVQASLLNVGMRIRKSVPEGYKTHKTATPPTIQTAISHRAPQTTPNTSDFVKPPREPVPDVYQHPRELLPYCGLNRIGGFAEQPVTNVHLYAGAENGLGQVNLFPLPAEAFKTPFSPGSAATQNATPNPANLQKRSWQDEEGPPSSSIAGSNFFFAFPVGVSEDEVPVSPLSSTPAHSLHNASVSAQAALRPFAQPKARRGRAGEMVENGGFLKDQMMDVDFENAEDMEGIDFEDAKFLRPWAEREVEMGGA